MLGRYQRVRGNMIFNDIKCGSGNVCIAGGGYSDITVANVYPLVALTTNGGLTWSYPIENGGTLPTDFNLNGSFNGVSCNGAGNTAVCMAVGSYTDTSSNNYPMIALSTNGGASWSYPIDKSSVLPPGFGGNGSLNSVSCSGIGATARCTAAGYYTGTDTVQYPLIALSTNGGISWSYVLTNQSVLPNSFAGNGLFGQTDVAISSLANRFNNNMQKFGVHNVLKKLMKSY